MTDYTTLHIDIKAHSARMLMPYFSVSLKLEEDVVTFLGMEKLDEIVVTRDGMNVTVSIWYDFGKDIPDAAWEMYGTDSLLRMMDASATDTVLKEMIVETVKILYPGISSTLKKAASKLSIFENVSTGENV